MFEVGHITMVFGTVLNTSKHLRISNRAVWLETDIGFPAADSNRSNRPSTSEGAAKTSEGAAK